LGIPKGSDHSGHDTKTAANKLTLSSVTPDSVVYALKVTNR